MKKRRNFSISLLCCCLTLFSLSPHHLISSSSSSSSASLLLSLLLRFNFARLSACFFPSEKRFPSFLPALIPFLDYIFFARTLVLLLLFVASEKKRRAKAHTMAKWTHKTRNRRTNGSSISPPISLRRDGGEMEEKGTSKEWLEWELCEGGWSIVGEENESERQEAGWHQRKTKKIATREKRKKASRSGWDVYAQMKRN